MPDALQLIIADDSPYMRWLVRSTLAPDYPEIAEAADGRELFGLLIKANVMSVRCVLVVDVRMPVYSGLEVLAAWRENEQPNPVIVITSFPDAPVEREVARLGGILLPKPFSTATLRQVVTEAARRSHAA
jgi:FixJ family two-component response regulator